jgi:hypothetical protein
MHTKTSVVLSIIALVAGVLLFAAGPIAANHKAWACGGWGGWGGWGCYTYGGWGSYSYGGFGSFVGW